MFKKLLIANRGEIAVRILRACREMDIVTVAVYSEADAHALHVALADEAVGIGPPDPEASYLNIGRILDAARQTGSEAIHPGYGFLAENADFAGAVRAAGLTFVGPDEKTIRMMGVKTTARATVQAAGVPVVPGSREETDDEALTAAAADIGYPLLVKAAAGGGGKGMRLVEEAAALPEAVRAARNEARNAFGDSRLYLEKYIVDPRHIEFQILGDAFGRVIHLFERECSIQRRHQKIIEETPAPRLDDALRTRMGAAATAAAEAAGYVNAGTVEFLVDREGAFYFLEMNTRLQVEHPVTELVTGIDLVKMQLRIAAGEPLPFTQTEISRRGHAIECRVYAEDPAHGFLPDTGPVLQAIEPAGPGVRVDTGVTTGDEVTHHYDPMLAKVIVLGEDRPAALQKMARALREYVLLGVTTNLPLLQDIIRHDAFRRGETTTDFLTRHFAGWQPPAGPPPDTALIVAALAETIRPQQDDAHAAALDRTGEDVFSPWRRLDRFRLGASEG